ncbi:MAG TPA: hypothetical protein VF008_13235, partial [Niastella sp.]
MKTFTHYPSRAHLGLILKIIITTIWLLCIASAAWAAPGIGQPPVSQTVCSGTSPAFTIGSVTATGPATFQWQVSTNSGGPYTNVTNSATYSGATTVTLTISNVTIGLNGNWYRCVVTDGTGSTQSIGANLTVNQSPAVELGPRGVFACVNFADVRRSLVLIPGYSYQWQLSTNNGVSWNNVNPADGYSGSTTNELAYPPIALDMDGYLYRYRVTDGGCTSTSIVLDTLHVSSPPVWRNIYPGPPNNSICPGGNITFADSATGSAEISYQWQMKLSTDPAFTDVVDNAVFSGSQSKVLQITGFNEPQGNQYHIQVTARYPSDYVGCSIITNPSGLTVRTLASVALQPTPVTVCANTDTAFRVTGAGSQTLTYQWQTDNGSGGAAWSNVGTSSARLRVLGVTTAMNGWQYRVTIGNACSPPATSNPVSLTVRRSGIWYGTQDIRWEEPRNWCGGVPDNTIDVLVPNSPFPPFMPNISDATGTAFFKSIIIESATRLTISGGTVDNMTGPYDIQGTVAYTAPRNQLVFPANHGSLEINGSGNKVLGSNVDI